MMIRHRVEPRGVNPPKKGEESFITELMIRRMGVLSWSVTVSFFTAGAINSRGIASMAFFVGYRSFFASTDRGRLMISLVSFVRYVSPSPK
jgi:hypothetical protein